MQLDLLQKEPFPVTQESAAALPGKTNESEEDAKAPGAFKTISEVAELLSVPQHVLRFWESRFPQVKPLYRAGRRYYRPQDVEILTAVQRLLYKEGYTIKGAKKALAPAKEEKAAAQKARAKLTDKQRAQLTVIRQELADLREALKSHLA